MSTIVIGGASRGAEAPAAEPGLDPVPTGALLAAPTALAGLPGVQEAACPRPVPVLVGEPGRVVPC